MGIPPQTEKAQRDAWLVGCVALILSIIIGFSLFGLMCLAGYIFVESVVSLIFFPPTTATVVGMIVSAAVLVGTYNASQFFRDLMKVFSDGNEDTDNV